MITVDTLSVCSQFHNAWVEAALESAIRNLVRIWPAQYEAEFGEEDRKFFKDKGQ